MNLEVENVIICTIFSFCAAQLVDCNLPYMYSGIFNLIKLTRSSIESDQRVANIQKRESISYQKNVIDYYG